MTTVKTIFSRDLSLAGEKVQYDEYAKRILTHTQILALILQHTVEECREYTADELRQLLEKTVVEVSTVPFRPGETNTGNTSAAKSPCEDGRIFCGETQDQVPGEGFIRFDVRFKLRLISKEQTVRLIINLEAQKSFYPGYHIVTRGILYGARLLSAQIDVEIKNSDYDAMEKVYSIWICMNAPDNIGNAMDIYSIAREPVVEGLPDIPEAYDKLTVILISLNEKQDTKNLPLHHLLCTLFSPTMAEDEKEQVLSNRFGMKMEYELREELSQMCNLSEAIEERGIEKGLNQGISAFVRVHKKFGYTQEETAQQVELNFPISDAWEKVLEYWDA